MAKQHHPTMEDTEKTMNHMDMKHSHSMGTMDHTMHMGNFKQKFYVSLILTIPILFLSPMMGMKLPFQISFPGSQWLVLLLATVLFFYGGQPFLQGAKDELHHHRPAMMTLIALGISVAYLYSLYAFVENNILHSTEHIMDFFWELATLIVIMLLGHWIEMNAVMNAGNAVHQLAALLPSEAAVVQEDGSVSQVPLEQVHVNQILRVKAGEKIPADGIIQSGMTTVNESMVTGEAKEVSKKVNDTVIGGAVNGAGTIDIQVTGTGQSGYLAQVMQLVSQAQNEKSKAETLSDKVARALFYVALGASILAFVVWFVIKKDFGFALEIMVTVLVIACPHALGLAIPLVVARSTSLGAKHGLLIKNRKIYEQAGKVNDIFMDKTGTLTEGQFSVSECLVLEPDYTEQEVVRWFASLENESNHPLATGIIRYAEKLHLSIPHAKEVENISGVGLSGKIDGLSFKIVNAAYLNKRQMAYDSQKVANATKDGETISFLLRNDEVVGMIAQADQIKSGASAFIEKLRQKGITPIMLTGDNSSAATQTAQQLGIEKFYAQLLPQEKEKIIADYRKKGDVTMMVGDGINDAPSLASADIGVAIGAGTDVAIDSADVVLVRSDPSDILHFLSLANHTERKMVQNLWWGAGYNIIAIPLAAGVLAPLGILLSPAVGAVLMSLSTIIVSINAMLLKMD